MKHLGQISGGGGADYYAAGTYVVGAASTPLLKPIWAVEWAGANFTVSAITDKDGITLDDQFNYITGSGIPVTTDWGLMTFGTDVYSITSDAAFKVWYSF